MHGLQAESEIFRRGTCGEDDDDEEAYREYQRRQRMEKKAQQKPTRPPAEVPQAPKQALAPTPVETLLAKEHDARTVAREHLVEREQRLQGYAEDAQGQLSEPMTAEDAGKQMAENQRAMQADTVEFVQSYR